MANEVQEREANGERWDAVLATDMLNVAEFRSLAPKSVSNLNTILYFHENQFGYPVKAERKKDLGFSFINVTSALAADENWFNSDFNRQSMLDEILKLQNLLPEFELSKTCDAIRNKSRIQYPGIDVDFIERQQPSNKSHHFHILWAARWEHDKNPQDLLATLRHLRERKFEFTLSVIGQRLQVVPEAFETISAEFSSHIRDWGFLPSRREYIKALHEADCFISTANHEFFGISAAEAIAAGAIPLLPNRLAYPELLGVNSHPDRKRFLYSNSPRSLADMIVETANEDITLILEKLKTEFRSKYDWKTRAAKMDEALQLSCENHLNRGL